MWPAPEHRAASPGLLAFSSLKEGATHSKLERKSTAKEMSRKDYNEESAESLRKEIWMDGEPETGGWLPVLSAEHRFFEPVLGIFLMQYQRALLCHPRAPWQMLKCTATMAVPTTAKLKNWPEAKALWCWRARWSPWELLGLLLSSGGQDHQEGQLCTTAFDPEKACPHKKKPGTAVKQRSWLALEGKWISTMLGITNPDEKQMYFNACRTWASVSAWYCTHSFITWLQLCCCISLVSAELHSLSLDLLHTH